jgi:hypothetical protein
VPNIAPEDPPGFVTRTEAQKAVWDNGFRLEHGVDSGWLHYASTTAHGEIWIAGISPRGPWVLSIDHPGVPQARNLINLEPERRWRNAAVVRYRNRRTFLRVLSDPVYARMEPYKFIALEIDLVPVSGKIALPDLRLVFGVGFAIIFLLVGWITAV